MIMRCVRPPVTGWTRVGVAIMMLPAPRWGSAANMRMVQCTAREPVTVIELMLMMKLF